MTSTNTMIMMDSHVTPWLPGPGWQEYPHYQFMGGSCGWARYDDNTSLTLPFTGLGISYIGSSVEFTPWNFTASIDDGPPEYHAMTQEPNVDQLTSDWYVSPPLGEGRHTLVLSRVTQGVAIDYTVVKPSPSQNLRDQILIVDDQDPLVKYTGNWKESNNRYFRLQDRPVKPYGGGAHISTTPGDILQFPFTGSLLRIYGFYDWTMIGSFNISFTFDNSTTEVAYPRKDDSQGVLMIQPNFLFYETAFAEGDHVLTINVTGIEGGQKVIIDAIHYKASFDTLATMPKVEIPGIPQPSKVVDKEDGPANRNTGAIIGAAVGAFVALILVALLAVFLRKRSRSPTNHFPNNDLNMVTEPFVLPEILPPPLSRDRDGFHLEWATADASNVTLTKKGRRPAPEPIIQPPSPAGSSVVDPRSSRMEQLERQVSHLARRTEALQNVDTQQPPPYDPYSGPA